MNKTQIGIKLFITRLALVTGMIIAYANLHAQTNKLYINFDSIAGREITSNYTISTNKKSLEIVPGFKGSGLRTDGYSTWVNASVPASTKGECSISGWFALETFSTDTAGFSALKNSMTNEWIAACFDTYGRAMIGFQQDGKTMYVTGDSSVEIFKWMHIALNVTADVAMMFVNGKLAVKMNGDFNSITKADSIAVGRDYSDRRMAIFPLNAMNGIIDEIAFSHESINEETLKKISSKTYDSIPSLKVPAIRFGEDYNRPRYHLIPAANWTNESHGLVRYKGNYHIFNQKDGNNLLLRKINWGHFSSPDLIHWTEHKPAIRPTMDYDKDGIWSGHAVLDSNGSPVIIYTGGSDDASICMATTADSGLIKWNKYPGNPVIKHPPESFHTKVFRDPYVFTDNGRYYMIVGFGFNDSGVEKGSVLLYRSTDLKRWEYLHPLFTGDPEQDGSGVFWEMPLFHKIDGKWVLLVNKVPHNREPADALYWVGDFANEKFVPKQVVPRHLEVVNRLLSPSVTVDEQGRTTAIAIIPDLISIRQQYRQGWTHLFSIPRIWVLKDGKICQLPHPALQQLRTDSILISGVDVTQAKPALLSSGKGQLELEIALDATNCNQFGLSLGKNASGSVFTNLVFDLDANTITVVSSDSSAQKLHLKNRMGNYDFAQRKFNLRLFIDGSMVEGFINEEDAFSTRMFPLDKEANRVELFGKDGKLKLLKAKVWSLKPAIVQQDF